MIGVVSVQLTYCHYLIRTHLKWVATTTIRHAMVILSATFSKQKLKPDTKLLFGFWYHSLCRLVSLSSVPFKLANKRNLQAWKWTWNRELNVIVSGSVKFKLCWRVWSLTDPDAYKTIGLVTCINMDLC